MNPSAKRLPRWWRLLVPGSGSVARTSDRVQAGLVVVAILVALAAIPFAVSAGSTAYTAQKQQSVRELAEDRPAIATLLADGPPATAAGRSGQLGSPMPTAASWLGPDGVRHVGQVNADRGAHRGDRVRIWVDGSGALVGPPLSPAVVLVNATAAAAGVFAATCLALALAHGITMFVMNRHRARMWQREWYAELAKKTHS
ncbi:MAG TPA: hypothetical protein VG674_12410 [Amycolatopsis sp.]|nr:hypothetical protein [Amycolatopsis sp.]